MEGVQHVQLAELAVELAVRLHQQLNPLRMIFVDLTVYASCHGAGLISPRRNYSVMPHRLLLLLPQDSVTQG